MMDGNNLRQRSIKTKKNGLLGSIKQTTTMTQDGNYDDLTRGLDKP